MKLKLLIILLYLTQASFGQIRNYEYILTNYDSTGNVISKSTKQFEIDPTKIDVYFFEEKFNIPFHFPENLRNIKHTSDSLSLWNNEHGEKDYLENYTRTFVFDSLSRIKAFGFSGCMVCSHTPYYYEITYNEKNQIIRFEDTGFARSTIDLKYNINGIIEQSDSYLFGKLIRRYKLVN